MKVGYLAAVAADQEEKKKKGLLSFTKSLFTRSSSENNFTQERGLRTSQKQVNARRQELPSATWAAEYNNP